MLSYFLKCRENTERKNPNALNTKNERIILLVKRPVCDSKKLKIIQQQEDNKMKR